MMVQYYSIRTLSEGAVLVCYNNTYYGTVCDDRWDSLDATVICKWLGFEGANGEAHTISCLSIYINLM